LTTNRKQENDHTVCQRGFSLVTLSWPLGRVLCNGLIVAGLNTTCPSVLRKANQGQKVAWEEILSWHSAVSKMTPLINQYCEEKARELIEGLHDVTTAVNLVTRNAEAIIATLAGGTDDEKIENAPPSLKSLLKSIELLRTRLSMSSIVANPESASFGQKHPIPVYRVFHRMVRLFEEAASRKQVKMRMTGSSHAMPLCFDSFDTLALVLIDNAVKYSAEESTIDVIVHDTGRTVKVAVQSYGPYVPREMQNKIFERGFRTPGAEKFAAQGSGLGLFIAKAVADAHGFSIHYKSFNVNQTDREGQNEFLFEVPLTKSPVQQVRPTH
jgi:two-component system sensor histidine kinase QseC